MVTYERTKPSRALSAPIDKLITTALRHEKTIIDDPTIHTVTRFNFYAVRDDLIRNHDITISATTIRNKAIRWNFYCPKHRDKRTYTSFERGGFGSLFQHDTSFHKWSPYMDKFYLILTIDDHSRYFVAGKFYLKETSMNHIAVLEETVTCYGIPLEYYVDRHCIFTGYDRKSAWKTIKKQKEDFEVQFKMVCSLLGIRLIYAGSANAKGKIERPFRYLQDRLCRRMAKEHVRDLPHAQRILNEEIEYYNAHKVHSTTREIPLERMKKSFAEKRSFVRKVSSLKNDLKDIFCLHYSRSVDKFGRISYVGYKLFLPKHVVYGKRVQVNVRIKDAWHHLRIFADGKYISNRSVKKNKD